MPNSSSIVPLIRFFKYLWLTRDYDFIGETGSPTNGIVARFLDGNGMWRPEVHKDYIADMSNPTQVRCYDCEEWLQVFIGATDTRYKDKGSVRGHEAFDTMIEILEVWRSSLQRHEEEAYKALDNMISRGEVQV